MILNEFEIAERVLAEKRITNKSDLFVVAKYLRQEANCDELETFNMLNEIMKGSVKNYIPAKSSDYLMKMIRKAAEIELKVVKNLIISESEFERIKEINNPKKERILFSLLVHAKFHNALSEDNDNWCGITIGELYKTAKVSTRNSKEKALLLNDLKNGGYIRLSRKNTNLNIRCEFVDNKSADSIYMIDDLRELGYQYISLTDPKQFVYCKKCGLIIKRNTVKDTSTKYCRTCLYEEKLVQKRNCFIKLDRADILSDR